MNNTIKFYFDIEYWTVKLVFLASYSIGLRHQHCVNIFFFFSFPNQIIFICAQTMNNFCSNKFIVPKNVRSFLFWIKSRRCSVRATVLLRVSFNWANFVIRWELKVESRLVVAMSIKNIYIINWRSSSLNRKFPSRKHSLWNMNEFRPLISRCFNETIYFFCRTRGSISTKTLHRKRTKTFYNVNESSTCQ